MMRSCETMVRLISHSSMLLLVLLGKSVEGFSMEQMCKLWHIAMVHISGMYNERVREGIG